MAIAYGAILTQFRALHNGGWYDQNYPAEWRYAGYSSRDDDFGSPNEDDAGIPNCEPDVPECDEGYTPCPSTHVCLTDEHAQSGCAEGGICARTCTTDSDCGRGLYCIREISPGNKVCWSNTYRNNWFTNVGSRLAMDAGWPYALRALAWSATGNDANGTRDFAIGADTWYGGMADALPTYRYEVYRAVRSVEAEPNLPWVDDFPNSTRAAVPITVRTTTGTPIWWGNGTYLYPRFEDLFDKDVVLFWGNAGSNYEVRGDPISGSAADLRLTVYRATAAWDVIADGHAPIGPSAILQTGTLLSSDWYAVVFQNRSQLAGSWQGSVRLTGTAAQTDEFSNASATAYPMASGVSISANLHSSDTDRFQIYVPVAGTSLTVSTSSSTAPLVILYRPNGTFYANGYGTVSVPSVPVSGHWQWVVFNDGGPARSYSTQASLGCATSDDTSCDNLASQGPIASRYSWGDRFAGRIPTASSYAEYTVTLDEAQHATFGLTDNNPSCSYRLELYGPQEMVYFTENPGQIPRHIWRWDDAVDAGGAAAGDPNRWRIGAGGHVHALVAGTYRVRVTAPGALSPCHYRLFIARLPQWTDPMPAW